MTEKLEWRKSLRGMQWHAQRNGYYFQIDRGSKKPYRYYLIQQIGIFGSKHVVYDAATLAAVKSHAENASK